MSIKFNKLFNPNVAIILCKAVYNKSLGLNWNLVI